MWIAGLAPHSGAALMTSGIFLILLVPQHLPREQLADSRAEHVLGGIDVTKTRPADVVRRLGEPARTDVRRDDEDPRWETRDYWWEAGGVRLRAGTQLEPQDGKFVESEIRFVDVWGTGPSKQGLGLTSAGLALGDDLAKIRRCYGSNYGSQSRHVTLQWKDGTTLEIDLDGKGRIIYMQLSSGEAT